MHVTFTWVWDKGSGSSTWMHVKNDNPKIRQQEFTDELEENFDVSCSGYKMHKCIR
jgi:hypothetical protein